MRSLTSWLRSHDVQSHDLQFCLTWLTAFGCC